MIIGITGSIGSGKTTVAKLFGKHWYSRIDADEISHQIIENDRNIKKRLVKNFGKEILDTRENRRFFAPRNFKKISTENKNIDRKKLGDIAFADDRKLKKLNSIVHPIIIQEIKNQIKKIQKKCGDKTRIVIDAPLLLETKARNLVDKIVVVKCDKEKIIEKLNNKYSKEKIEKILNVQMPLNEKLKYADFVIDNSKDLNHLKKQVEKIVRELNK